MTTIIEHPEYGRVGEVTVITKEPSSSVWTKEANGCTSYWHESQGWQEVPQAVDVTEHIVNEVCECKYDFSTGKEHVYKMSFGLLDVVDIGGAIIRGHKTQAVVLPEGWRQWTEWRVRDYCHNHEQSVLTIKKERKDE